MYASYGPKYAFNDLKLSVVKLSKKKIAIPFKLNPLLPFKNPFFSQFHFFLTFLRFYSKLIKNAHSVDESNICLWF